MSARVEQNLEHLVEDWTTAELHGDAATLERMLTNEFVGVGPRGFMLTKSEWIQRHQSGDLKYQYFKCDDLQMRAYGDTVVATAHQTQKATYQGQDVPGQFRTTLVLVKGQGQWRLASVHLSRIIQAP